MDLLNYFDRVVVLNLKRRPDRLARLNAALRECHWPFKHPTVFSAVDGNLVPFPEGWQSGAGAWGCMRSHQRIFEEAMMDRVSSLLVLEDDVCFVADFVQKVADFLTVVPDDWDQLMFGGQHFNGNGDPILVKPGVLRCIDCERTHCYAIRGDFLKNLYRRWIRGGEFNGEIHCDWIMGRDPQLQRKHKVYAPERFLVGQLCDKSDIHRGMQSKLFWNAPDQDQPVIFLRAPKAVVQKLRPYGLHTGYSIDPSGTDKKLLKIFAETQDDPDDRAQHLGKWIERIQWEVASDPHLICTVWHPEATLELIKEAIPRSPVYEVVGNTLSAVLGHLPPSLRRSPRGNLALACVIHLDAPRAVMDGLRDRGWHNGFSLDEHTGFDIGLVKICNENHDRNARTTALVAFIHNLQAEAERIQEGVVVIWHPEIDAEMVQAASDANVVRIAAKDIDEAVSRWEETKALLRETDLAG